MKKKFNVLTGKGVLINRNNFFEGNNYINHRTQVYDSYIGYGSYISQHSVIQKTEVGRFCALGDNVKTGIGRHPSSKFVSIHPAFFSTNTHHRFSYMTETIFEEHQYIDDEKKYYVKIGNDVWVGNDVSIMDGIKIGDGAIIGLGSIVNKNIEPYSICVGTPAKKIGYRFTPEQIDFLLDLQWWNKDLNWIKSNSRYFKDIDVLKKKYKA